MIPVADPFGLPRLLAVPGLGVVRGDDLHPRPRHPGRGRIHPARQRPGWQPTCAVWSGGFADPGWTSARARPTRRRRRSSTAAPTPAAESGPSVTDVVAAEPRRHRPRAESSSRPGRHTTCRQPALLCRGAAGRSGSDAHTGTPFAPSAPGSSVPGSVPSTSPSLSSPDPRVLQRNTTSRSCLQRKEDHQQHPKCGPDPKSSRHNHWWTT
jgi:hypothetical protein